MKKMRRFAAIAAAAAMTACMAVPMMSVMTASATKVSISSTNTAGQKDQVSHVYTAYQIFTGSYDDNGLTIDDWGSGINNENLLADTAFTRFVVVDAVADNPETDEVDETVVQQTIADLLKGSTEADVVAQAFEKIGDKSPKADALAKILAKHIKGSGTPVTSEGVNLGAGYYIVTDSYTTGEGTNDALSKFILEVSGKTDPIVITTKKSYPTVVKKVQENTNVSDYRDNNETEDNYNDVADYNIGDKVPFRLYGTMPETLEDYVNGYKYVFHDTIASTLTLVDSDDDNDDVDVVVAIDGTLVGGGYVVENTNDGFTVTFANILAATDENNNKITVTKNSIVTVSYEATLDADAVIGLDGQENEVYLEYSNNPNWDGSGTPSTDTTPKDKVIVFTYEIDVTKEDDATGDKLANAKFKLANALTGGQYAILNEVDDEDNTYTFGGWSNEGTEVVTDSTGLIKIRGLDEATYYLEETEAPASYTGLTDRAELEVIANTMDSETSLIDEDNANPYNATPNRQAWDGVPTTALKELGLSVDGAITAGDIDEGTVGTTITNKKGTVLPSTGGIGTTLFYVIGGTLAAGAGVALIAKKRMKNEE